MCSKLFIASSNYPGICQDVDSVWLILGAPKIHNHQNNILFVFKMKW